MGNILTEVILTAKEELDQALNKANNVIPQLIDDIDKKLEETKELVDGAGAASKQEVEEVKSSLEEKVTKVQGKGLSTHDYDDTEKSEVAKVKNKADTTRVDDLERQIGQGVTDEQLKNAVQSKVDDGTIGSIQLGTNNVKTENIDNGQVTPVKTSFIESLDNNIAKDILVLKGYLDYSNGAFTPSENFETTDFIELEQGIKYICEFSGSNGTDTLTTPRAIIIYNKDESFSRRLELPIGMTSGALSAKNSNEKYVRVNMLKTNNILKIYPISGHKIENILSNIKVPFNNIVDIPKQEATGSSFNFIGRPRKAIISFILDGEYDMNSTMELIFSNKGFRVGFAPQYVTNWSNNPITTYLEWQAKGHEILSHGTYVLNDSASYTEEEVKAIIENSYNTLVNQGFNIKGFIGSSGKVADKYLKYVRDYYEYSATEPNHSGAYSGTGAEPCLYFKTDAPYKIWRYSIQGSTLEQMKSAVDKSIETNGLLIFYGHAQSTNNDNFTTTNLTALCDYILSKKCKVLTPYEAIKEYYSVRWEDIVIP